MGRTTASARARDVAVGRVNAFFVVVHNKHPPTDEEWTEVLDSVDAMGIHHGTVARVLVVTEGGAPTLAQRKAIDGRLSSMKQDHPSALRTAIVTPSTFVRGFVTALGLVHPLYRAFAPEDMRGAYEYLGIPPAYHGEIEALIASLKGKLGP